MTTYRHFVMEEEAARWRCRVFIRARPGRARSRSDHALRASGAGPRLFCRGPVLDGFARRLSNQPYCPGPRGFANMDAALQPASQSMQLHEVCLIHQPTMLAHTAVLLQHVLRGRIHCTLAQLLTVLCRTLCSRCAQWPIESAKR